MFLNIINFFKKINIFTHAVKEALKIKQDIDHIDDKEFINIDFNEVSHTIKLSFKDIIEEYPLDHDISFDKVYDFLSKHFKYYPYNIILNGSFIPKDYDPFFTSYKFNTTDNNSDDENILVLNELKSLYQKEFNVSFNENTSSIIYFTEVYPYKVKIVLFIDNDINLLNNITHEDDEENDDYNNNFRIYNSSILYTNKEFPFIPEFLYKIQPSSVIKLIVNIEGIDSSDQFKSQNIQTFLTRKLADIISSKIQPNSSIVIDRDNTVTSNEVSTYPKNNDPIKYWNKFSYFIKQAVVNDPLFFSKIKDNLILELKHENISYVNINEFLKDKDKYRYSNKYKLNINPKYSNVEYDYINFLTDQIGSSVLLDLL